MITYDDKVSIVSNPNPDINKVTDTDMNQIKTEVNKLAVLTVNPQSIDYDFALSDEGNIVELTGSNNRTFTVLPDSSVDFQDRKIIYALRSGSGVLTIAAGVGVTITATATVLTDPGQNVIMTLVKTGTNTWVLQNGSPSVTWTAWTPTLTGFASTTLNEGGYVIEGKKCTFWLLVAGTAAGSSPTSTITNMPAISKKIWPQLGIVVNNTTTQQGRGDIAEGTTVMTFWATVAQGSFTSSVGRQLYFNGTYEIQ